MSDLKVISPDVLLIARQDDSVAVRLGDELAARGQRVVKLDGPSAARVFTLHGGALRTTVQPHLPVFIRPSAWWQDEASDIPDTRFLRGECHATLWAALALSAAPVINRPGRNGLPNRLTAAALAVLHSSPGASVREIFASGPDQIPDPNSQFWGEDVLFRAGPLACLRPDVPLRARAVEQDALYEIVAVVGHRAYPATTDLQSEWHELGPRSVALAKDAGVHFATVTWAVSGATAAPVRLNPGPDESELRYVWRDTVAALCEDLTV